MIVAIGAVQVGERGLQPLAGQCLPVRPRLEAGDGGVAEVHCLHAVLGLGLAAGGNGLLTGQLRAGDVVGDAVAVDRDLIAEVLVLALQAQLDLGGVFGFDLRTAGIVVPVGAGAGLVALAHVGRPEGTRDVHVGAQQRVGLVDHAETAGGGTIGTVQAGGDGAVVDAAGTALDAVVPQAGQHVERTEVHVILHVDAGRLHLAIGERQVGHPLGELRRTGRAAVRAGRHAPDVDPRRQQVFGMHQPVGPGIHAGGGKGHVVADDVAPQQAGLHVDGAVHLLPVHTGIDVDLAGHGAPAAVAHFVERALLPWRVGQRVTHHVGQWVAANAARVPDIVLALVLGRHAQLLLSVQPVAVLADEGAGIVAGMRHLAAGCLVIPVLRGRQPQHQRMIALAEVAHRGTTKAAAGRVEAGLGTQPQPRFEFRLRHLHVDGATQRAGAVEHRGRPLDHFHPLGQAHRDERGDGPHRLRRIEAHAVDQQHHPLLAQPANDRILALGAVGGHGHAGLVTQCVTHVRRLLALQLGTPDHGGGHRGFGRIGLVALGGDVDGGQGGLRLGAGRQQAGDGGSDAAGAVHGVLLTIGTNRDGYATPSALPPCLYTHGTCHGRIRPRKTPFGACRAGGRAAESSMVSEHTASTVMRAQRGSFPPG